MSKPSITSDSFRVLHVDVSTGQGKAIDFGSKAELMGGSGLAAALFEEFGDVAAPALDPGQPLIFAIGSLTGLYPLMSKVVCAFKSPYNEQYAESHAGGRMAMALRFSGYEALILTGKAPSLTFLEVGSRRIQTHDVHYMRGQNVFATGKLLRKLGAKGTGHRSIVRIGPAGENLVSYACINVDTYRHFGRLGAGAVMGSKNLKAVQVRGDHDFMLPEGKEYAKVFKDVFKQLTTTDMMNKYYDLGTAANLKNLDNIKSLPWKNCLSTSEPDLIDGVSGEKFAEELLLRQTACSGCPVGCIHIGLLRHMYASQHEYLYKQVSYDYEPIFACGTMLGMTSASDVLAILDEVEKVGLDCMSAGVALAWATEAFQKGLITENETVVPLEWDNVGNYMQAVNLLGARCNEFYHTLGEGALVAGDKYNGADFACVLGQEMAGYATGENFYVAEALGFRHSHLDVGSYGYDQKHNDHDVQASVDFMLKDEPGRVQLTSMVSCLFARGAYTQERLQECLGAVGLTGVADNLAAASEKARRKRWKLKFACGFRPEEARIPKRYMEVETWKGKADPGYLNALKDAYGKAITELAENAD